MNRQNQWQTLQGEVGERQGLFDRLTRRMVENYTRSGRHIHCGKGCRDCCSLTVNCTYPEALRVAASLNEAQTARIREYAERLLQKMGDVSDLKSYLKMQRTVMGYCPLLANDGSCSVYEHRPFSCRSLLATKERRWCGTDFSQLSSDEKKAFMDSLDREAVAFPMHYLAAGRELGEQFEAQSSLAMAGVFGFTVTGNLPFLVYLETEHGFAGILSCGLAAGTEFLHRTGLFHPFLISMEEI